MMSSSTSPEPSSDKPAPRLTVPMRDSQREIFMSFGMLNELAGLVGGPEGVPRLSFDPSTTLTALELMLAKRDKYGKILEPGPDEDAIVPLDLPPEIAEQLIDWAGSHVLDFFVRRFAKNTHLMMGKAGQLAAVGSSLTSLGTSPGKTA